jgi:hypothetical protein
MDDALKRALDGFVKLEARFVRASNEHDFATVASVLLESVECAAEIYWHLASEGAVTTNEPALRRFRDEGFTLQEALSRIIPGPSSLANRVTGRLGEFPPAGGDWLADGLLSRLLDPTEPEFREAILERLLSVQVLLVAHNLPVWLRRHVLTLRRCYALRLTEPTWLFLRALLEAASFHWLVEHGHLAREGPVRSIAERKLSEAMRLVAVHSGIPRRQLDRVWGVIDKANRLVHGKRDVPEPSDQETLTAISTVVSYVEFLFGA